MWKNDSLRVCVCVFPYILLPLQKCWLIVILNPPPFFSSTPVDVSDPWRLAVDQLTVDMAQHSLCRSLRFIKFHTPVHLCILRFRKQMCSEKTRVVSSWLESSKHNLKTQSLPWLLLWNENKIWYIFTCLFLTWDWLSTASLLL